MGGKRTLVALVSNSTSVEATSMSLWRAKPDPHSPRSWVVVAVYVIQLAILAYMCWAAAKGSPWLLIIFVPLTALLLRAAIRELRRR